MSEIKVRMDEKTVTLTVKDELWQKCKQYAKDEGMIFRVYMSKVLEKGIIQFGGKKL